MGLSVLPGADPSKIDPSNMMVFQGPNGSTVGYRNNENGTFVPVTQAGNLGLSGKQGLFQGSFDKGFYEFGNSPDEISARIAKMLPSINTNYFGSDADVDRIMRTMGVA